MKRIIILLFSLVLVGISNSPLFAQDNGNTIIVFEDELGDNGPQRSLSIPVEAVYLGASSSIVFTFTQNVGTVNITVTNTQTGEYVVTPVNTSISPFEIVPISGDSGLYTIRVLLNDNTTYYAELELP